MKPRSGGEVKRWYHNAKQSFYTSTPSTDTPRMG